MTIPGQYRSSTAYITGPLQCVSNGPITFCTSFPYRPDTCSRYWPGNGPLQYGTGPVSPHTVPGQYRTGTVTLYRFGTGPIPYRYRYTVPFRYWPNNISYLMAHYTKTNKSVKHFILLSFTVYLNHRRRHKYVNSVSLFIFYH